jgi:putative SOS response-associated peptidase YedK
MCNRYSNTISYRQYVEAFDEIGIPIVSPGPEAAPNLEPLPNIAPTDMAPILRPVAGGVELCRLRWGLIPWFHKQGIKDWKPLTTNARVETLATTKTFQSAAEKRRCLVPVSHFYEWTSLKGKKTKWSFSRSNGEWFCFAGIWDRAHTSDGILESYALITTEAGPDTKPYHTRQPVILERNEYTEWMLDAVLPRSAVKPQEGGLLKVVETPKNLA